MKACVIRRADCLRFLPTLASGSVDLLCTDQPYNIGVKYDAHHDKMPAREYGEWCWRWLRECVRVLRTNGSAFLFINDENAWRMQAKLEQLGMRWRNTIIWAYEFGNHSDVKFGRNHTQVLYYVKGDAGEWNADAVRVPSKRQTQYNDKRAHPLGRVVGDVWNEPRICGTFKRKIKGVPNQIPLPLLERIIRATTEPDDVVLDPFLGSGSTAVACKRTGRRFVGCEVSAKVCKLAAARVRRGE